MHVCSVSFRETECSQTPGATPFYENTTAKGVDTLVRDYKLIPVVLYMSCATLYHGDGAGQRMEDYCSMLMSTVGESTYNLAS